MAGGPPNYKVYRSRGKLGSSLRRPGRDELGRRTGRDPRRLLRAFRPGRIIKLLILAAILWILASIAVFYVSAGLAPGIDASAELALSRGGPQSLLTGTNVLVLGSDARPEGSRQPGAGEGPPRADSILLLRASLGRVRRLSILRDSLAQIPGHEPAKINASYALGGPGLTVRTVESFLDDQLVISHAIEVSFENFRELIEALGGIDVTIERCIRSQPFDGRVFRLGRGTHHLNGRQALAFARVRKNMCAPNENDAQRAGRQQQVIGAIRSRLISPGGFMRLPFASWAAPRALRTDMAGFGLSLLFLDVLTSPSGETRVLQPAADGPGGTLLVSPEEKREAVSRLLGN